MKKALNLLSMTALATLGLVACSSQAPEVSSELAQPVLPETQIKIGMITDAGTIDDKSFNQGTWEGILRYVENHPNVVEKYVQPKGESTQDYLDAIDNLVLADHDIIVAPGFKFEEAIGMAQVAYPDIKFILIDGQPLVGEDYIVADNTVSIFFSEEEAGFLAGIAAALESQTGQLGFVGGMEVPAVQKLGWGFVAGVAYANETYGTEAQVVDYLYQGTFTEVDAGKVIAGGMYDKDIDIIFAAAGGVGVGVIGEAKTRAEAGDHVYVIGVDIDQYEEGLLTDGRSIILTSAMKRIDQAAYDYIDAALNQSFPGGSTILMNASLNGIGLPDENPNLSEDVLIKTKEAFELIQAGEVVVPAQLENLIAYLAEFNYPVAGLTY